MPDQKHAYAYIYIYIYILKWTKSYGVGVFNITFIPHCIGITKYVLNLYIFIW